MVAVSDDDDPESFLGVSPAVAELFVVVVSFEGVDVGAVHRRIGAESWVTVAGGLAAVGVVSDDWFASLDVELAVADGWSADAIAGGVANAPPMPGALLAQTADAADVLGVRGGDRGPRIRSSPASPQPPTQRCVA